MNIRMMACVASIICLALLMLFSSSIQAEERGGITGRVADLNTGSFLPGANVVIEGTNFGAATDREGMFRLRNVPPGDYTVKVTYIGYETESIDVTVVPGEVITLNVNLLHSFYEVDQVVIVGLREGQQRALSEQFTASNIRNIADREQIELFPDRTVPEVLARIPGVNISRTRGEGSYAYIRGTSPELTNVTVDGQHLGTTRGDSRAHQLTAIAADQLAGIEVIKAITPDMEANAVGGAINMITRTAFDYPQRRTLNMTVGGGFEDQAGAPMYRGSITYAERFGADEKFGLVLNASYDRLNRVSHHSEYGNWRPERDAAGNLIPFALEEIRLRYFENIHDRHGFSGAMEYRPSIGHRFYVRGTYNYRDGDQFRTEKRNRFDRGDYISPTEVTEGRIEIQPHDQRLVYQMHAFGIGGSNILGRNLEVNYDLAYSYGEESKPDGQFISEFRMDGRPAMRMDLSNIDFPKFTITNIDNWEDYMMDPANYRFRGIDYRTEHTGDQNIMGSVNFNYSYDFFSMPAELKWGGRVSMKTKDRDNWRADYSWRGDRMYLSDFYKDNIGSMSRGHYTFGPRADRYALRDLFWAHKDDPAYFRESVDWDENIAENYDLEENVYAYYLMTTVDVGNLHILAGFRHEFTDVTYNGAILNYDMDGDYDSHTEITETDSYNNIFPNIHFRYRVTPQTNLRLALTSTIARPGFFQLIPFQIVEPEDLEIVRGNPNLKPTTSFNIDLIAEHYFQAIGILSAGFFYKDISDPIYPISYRVVGGELDQWEISEPVNGGKAALYGIELNWQQQFTFLPGFWEGFGIFANYTYTDSDIDLVHKEYEEHIGVSRFPGQAANAGNVALTYNKYGLNARLSYTYNGAFLAGLRGEGPGYHRWQGSDNRLSFSGSYRLFRGVEFFLEMDNLLNSPDYMYIGEDEARPRYYTYYGWSSQAGIKIRM